MSGIEQILETGTLLGLTKAAEVLTKSVIAPTERANELIRKTYEI